LYFTIAEEHLQDFYCPGDANIAAKNCAHGTKHGQKETLP
jgi:hypothetical protein